MRTVIKNFLGSLVGAFIGVAICATVLTGQTQVGNYLSLILGTAHVAVTSGSAAPEGSVTAVPGSLYLRSTGGSGTSLYVKESGNSNTGWRTAGGVKVVTVSVTDTQIKALPSSQVELIAAPGAGYSIGFVWALLQGNFAAGHYTNVNAAAYGLITYGNGNQLSTFIANDAGVMPVLGGFDAFFKSNNHVRAFLVPFAQEADPASTLWGSTALVDVVTEDNQPIDLRVDNNGSGNLTGGNSANVLTVTVAYTVVAVP